MRPSALRTHGHSCKCRMCWAGRAAFGGADGFEKQLDYLEELVMDTNTTEVVLAISPFASVSQLVEDLQNPDVSVSVRVVASSAIADARRTEEEG